MHKKYLLCLIPIMLGACFYYQTLEDAHITYRYALHLAHGDKLGAWNTGEDPVEGFSSMLWMLMLSAAVKAHLNIIHASKILGLSSYALLVFVPLYVGQALAKKNARLTGGVNSRAFYFTAVSLAFYLPLAWYSTSGMETVTFALLVAMVFYWPFISESATVLGTLGALIVLMRPEGILIAGLTYGCHVMVRWRNAQRLRAPLVGLASAVIAFAVLTVFRLWYFGYPAPNTYYAKAAGGLLNFKAGFIYVIEFIAATASVFTLIFAGCMINSRRTIGQPFTIFALFLTALYMLYCIKVGGDPVSAFPLWRHFVHLAPIWLFALGAICANLFEKNAPAILVLGFVLLVADLNMDWAYHGLAAKQLIANIRGRHFFQNEPPNPYFIWLDQFAGGQALISTSLAGRLPYYVRGSFIDAAGLNDAHIAHFGTVDPDGPVDSRSDMNYVLSRKPDIIEGYFSGLGLREGKSRTQLIDTRTQMINTMLDNPSFRTDYEFVANAPYEDLDRVIFVRKDFLEKRGLPAGLEAIPVAQTSIYQSDPTIAGH
jgi:hypothetical protein